MCGLRQLGTSRGRFDESPWHMPKLDLRIPLRYLIEMLTWAAVVPVTQTHLGYYTARLRRPCGWSGYPNTCRVLHCQVAPAVRVERSEPNLSGVRLPVGYDGLTYRHLGPGC
eukprot:6186845-Pleurochrysis_carterae.AAC.1